MRSLDTIIIPLESVCDYLKEKFHYWIPGVDQRSVNNSLIVLGRYLNGFIKGLFVCIEFPYVDKLYRNQYYYYYSSKLRDYPRDCIRLSFFNHNITNDDFRTQDRYGFLEESFLGFLVLRPTLPHLIGRSVISPRIFSNPSLLCCTTDIDVSVNGIRLKAHGYPHSSQDSEMMVCAETTIWALMEYFASRYAEYRPALPQKIHSILSNYSTQRQIPSSGLTALEISYALKKLGFGVKVYAKESYGEDFKFIFKSYVESGIPIICCLENGIIGHVSIYIGRINEKINAEAFAFKNLSPLLSVADFFQQTDNYVSIDDNHHPYTITPFDSPAIHYSEIDAWNGCEIASLIVPLYPKIYVEADQAKKLSEIALRLYNKKNEASRYIFRTFLSSCRSYKHYIAINSDMDSGLKELLINISMPKFVWITEIITIDDYNKDKASGVIIIDATDNSENGILAFVLGSIYIAKINGVLNEISIPLHPFNNFNNLNTF